MSEAIAVHSNTAVLSRYRQLLSSAAPKNLSLPSADMRPICERGLAAVSAPPRALVVLVLMMIGGGTKTSTSEATTLVAARFEGGVVIGADSRTSQGSFVANRLTDKISPVAPSIFLARSGSSAGASIQVDSRQPAFFNLGYQLCR